MRGAAVSSRGRATSKTYTLPAPVGGLNAVDALANMPETDAIVMDNWFPQPSYVETRNGYSNWSTGLPAWVETLLPYANASGEKLFAISGTAVYNVTTTGAVGAAVVTSLTNARWESTNIATSGGQFMYACNGTDKPLFYDGTSWVKVDSGTTPAITGVTTTKLRSPVVWKNRLWFVEEASMRAWYLPTSSIGGAAQSFDFGPIFRLGGQLHVIATASLTDGSTFDDYICFMSTEGEVAIYRGTDPAQAGQFAIQGIYRMGKPIGRRCVFNVGQDSIIICSDGFASLSRLISIGRKSQQEDISYKILQLVNQDVQAYSSNFGWEGILYPLGNKIIVNVPETTNNTQHQYVQNTISDAWCRFTGWNAATFCTLGDSLYFGGNTIVALADSGASDAGTDINCLFKTAFSYFKSTRQKKFNMARLLFQATGDVQSSVHLDLDFDNSDDTQQPSTSLGTGSAWNVSDWNTSSWTSGYSLFKNWQTVYGVGFSASLYVRISANTISVRHNATDFVYEPGGTL